MPVPLSFLFDPAPEEPCFDGSDAEEKDVGLLVKAESCWRMGTQVGLHRGQWAPAYGLYRCWDAFSQESCADHVSGVLLFYHYDFQVPGTAPSADDSDL
eukprot:g6854.t1